MTMIQTFFRKRKRKPHSAPAERTNFGFLVDDRNTQHTMHGGGPRDGGRQTEIPRAERPTKPRWRLGGGVE